jgi:predicted ester cyclase
MGGDAIETLYCRFVDSVINRRRAHDLEQFLARDVVEHCPARGVGLTVARQRLASWLVAFPDLHLAIADLVADDTRLMARLVATGTHLGTTLGIDPTGRKISVGVFEAWRLRDARCVERWVQFDQFTLLDQLGLPGPCSSSVSHTLT